ncbi:MAG: hypothetical protein OXH69_17720 [Acidobacteria bacterium]|nr:hypothetical protein [Acidobacteriota bacterium]
MKQQLLSVVVLALTAVVPASAQSTYEARYEITVTDSREGIPTIVSQRTGRYVFDETGNQRREHSTLTNEQVAEIWLPGDGLRYAINLDEGIATVGPMDVPFNVPGLVGPGRTAPARARRPAERSDVPDDAVPITRTGSKAHGPVLLHGWTLTEEMRGGYSQVSTRWEYRPPLDLQRRSPILVLESESHVTDSDERPMFHVLKRITSIRRLPATGGHFALPAGTQVVRDIFDEIALTRGR